MKNRRSLNYHEVTEQWGHRKSDVERKMEYYRDANGVVRRRNWLMDEMTAALKNQTEAHVPKFTFTFPNAIEDAFKIANDKMPEELITPVEKNKIYDVSDEALENIASNYTPENERRKNEAMEVEPPVETAVTPFEIKEENIVRIKRKPDFRVGQVVSMQGAAAVIDLRPIPSDRGRLSVKPLCGSTECASVIVSESDLTLLTSDDGYDVETGEVRRGLFMGCPLEMTETREVDLKTRRVISTIKRVEQPKEE